MPAKSPTLTSALIVGAITGLLLLATGCSSFRRDWKRAHIAPGRSTGLEGRWQGTWKSKESGHGGALQCMVTRLEGNRHRARFRATYWHVLKFTHGVILETTTNDGVLAFTGEADLGWWGGGLYEYKGTATPGKFRASYRSKYDHGLFEMSRPPQ